MKPRSLRLGSALLAATVFVPAMPAQAATITVTTTADDYDMVPDGDCSLREAITSANSDAAFGGCPTGMGTDTIQLAAGPYEVTRADSMPLISTDDVNVTGDFDITTDDLVIQGPPGGMATIDGNDHDRVLHVQAVTATMERLTITDGTARIVGITNRDGGGILVASSGSLTLRDSVVGSNGATALGGGISGSNLIIESSTIVSNTGALGGGGIAKSVGVGTIAISDSIIDNNTGSTSGGGVHSIGGDISLVRTLVRDNKTNGSGGGILSQPASAATTLSITDSMFETNTANQDMSGGGEGGAIWNGSGLLASDLVIEGTTIVGNLANDGDGIYNATPGSVAVTNSTISSNGSLVTGGQGGGLHNASSGSVTLSNVTLDANSASSMGSDGGNIYNAGSVEAKNVLMGFALTSGNCGGPAAVTQTGPNLEDASFGGGCGFTTSTSLGLDAPADNGGPQLPENVGPPPTQALEPGSPAIDGGAGCEATDQRGVPRPQGAACDVGAFEVGICAGMASTKIGVAEGEATLTGTPGNDVILGLGGNERIEGQGGDDALCGGDGNDQVLGGAGSDTLEGGQGSDTLEGEDGGDALTGGGGNDTLLGAAGADTLTDDQGADTLNGGADNDQLASGAGADLLLGDPGNDVASGGPDNDRLKGGSGKDKLKGDAGKDRLAGQKGKDRCSGGPGKDKANRSCEKTPGIP